MARLTGPFMSLAASGTLAKTLTASIWKGQPYMRLRVIPQNPQTDGQQTLRSVLGTLAKACRAVLTSFKDIASGHPGSEFFQQAVIVAPAGQSWISYLQKTLNSAFAGLVTAYGALTTVAGYYDSSATSIGLAPYMDKMGVTHDAGEQLYDLAFFAVTYLGYTGFATGIDTASSGEVSDFADYVHVTA